MQFANLKEHLSYTVDKAVMDVTVMREYQERNTYYIKQLFTSIPDRNKIFLPDYRNDELIVKNRFVKIPVKAIRGIQGDTITLYSGLKFTLPAHRKGIRAYGEWGGPTYYSLGLVVPKKLLTAAMCS